MPLVTELPNVTAAKRKRSLIMRKQMNTLAIMAQKAMCEQSRTPQTIVAIAIEVNDPRWKEFGTTLASSAYFSLDDTGKYACAVVEYKVIEKLADEVPLQALQLREVPRMNFIKALVLAERGIGIYGITC